MTPEFTAWLTAWRADCYAILARIHAILDKAGV